LVWTLIGASGLNLPVDVPLWVILPGVLGGLSLPVWQLRSEARRRHRLAQRVVCSFLDLVVLGLAAGMGIESALVAAAQLGETDVSRKIAAVLSLSRDSGEAPWAALARLGTTLGVDELSEVAAAAALAGTEGARIRATLAARAASIRRHELADAEAEANATTERLFLPGALLLVGFLLFVGYPAFSRISSGL
jgi:Flp pilus assembly protein TadB